MPFCLLDSSQNAWVSGPEFFFLSAVASMHKDSSFFTAQIVSLPGIKHLISFLAEFCCGTASWRIGRSRIWKGKDGTGESWRSKLWNRNQGLTQSSITGRIANLNLPKMNRTDRPRRLAVPGWPFPPTGMLWGTFDPAEDVDARSTPVGTFVFWTPAYVRLSFLEHANRSWPYVGPKDEQNGLT